MPTLSLITAVLPSMAQHIGETDASVGAAKELFQGSDWQLEWIVTVDGPGDMPVLPNADLVQTLPKKSGVSAARNYALASVTGEWIAPLDGDDTIEAEGALAIVQTIGPDEPAQWIGANRVHMDGSKTRHWNDQIAHWYPGEFVELWRTPFYFHPNSVLVRRECALAVGGWPALPCNEDVGFVLALSENGQGRFTTLVFNHYRIWDQQTIADPQYIEFKKIALSITEKTINAMRSRVGRTPIKSACCQNCV